MSTAEASSRPALKHRACDECRARKLACSKEPSGCSRCTRENIRCVYSPQKQMGRPRKRQHVEDTNDELDVRIVPETDSQPLVDDPVLIDPYPDTNVLPFPVDNTAELPKSLPPNEFSIVDDGRAVFHFGTSMINNPLDFGTDFDTDESRDSSDTSPIHASAVSMVPTSENSPKDGPACSCLASMYLAMAALQQLPTESAAALTIVRSALYSAQAVLRCEKCGTVLVTQTTPSIEAFQNTMLLGTILPTIVDSYRKLLVMVDEETDRAQRLGTKMIFRLSDYGGIFDIDGLCCETLNQYENQELDPAHWRATVRALLRTDIYGHHRVATGLVGVIAEMEQRQRDRHANLDMMKAAGLWSPDPNSHCYRDQQHIPQCMQILNMAKDAVNRLVIA